MEQFYEEKIEKGLSTHPFQSHMQTHAGAETIVRAHWHDYIEILYCHEGRQTIYLNGAPHAFTPGDLAIINSREVHHIVALTQENRYTVVKFQPELLYSTAASVWETRYVLPFTMQESTHQRIFTREELSGTPVPALIGEIYEEFTHMSYGFELAVRANICQLFLWILRRWNDQGIDLNIGQIADPKAVERLDGVFDFIDAHFRENITVEDMAALCGMSYSYFSRLFKRVMRRNFREYLNFVRISEAEKLLSTTGLNITEIALESGFSSSAYFIQQFKRFKNMSPKRYRSYIRDWKPEK